MVRSEFKIADFLRDDKHASEARPPETGRISKIMKEKGQKEKKYNPGKNTVSVVKAKIIMKY